MNIVKAHRMGSVLTEISISISIIGCEQLFSKFQILISLIFLTPNSKKAPTPFHF